MSFSQHHFAVSFSYTTGFTSDSELFNYFERGSIIHSP